MSTSRQRSDKLVVGTRASTLAQVQTGLVVAALQARHPELSFETRLVHTRGDHDRRTPLAELGGEGIFVKELEGALLTGEIDLAVHSLKDMPAVQPPDLVIAAVLPREDARDALVSQLGLPLAKLPHRARVGTSALRREAQLRALRPDLQLLPLRGNVDTRLRKVREGEYDAIVLALAGLVRLGRQAEVTEVLPLEAVLPAPGQGAIAVEARAGDAGVLAALEALDDPGTRAATAAERSLLRELGGGCHVPIAAHATVEGDVLYLRALVADLSGTAIVRSGRRGPMAQAEALGRALARELVRLGCAELLAVGGGHA